MGKRKRSHKQFKGKEVRVKFSKSVSQKSMEEAEPSNSSTIEEDINFITSNSNPNKRRHVSSISKAMLAKKILNKIETENDPFQNVNSNLSKA